MGNKRLTFTLLRPIVGLAGVTLPSLDAPPVAPSGKPLEPCTTASTSTHIPNKWHTTLFAPLETYTKIDFAATYQGPAFELFSPLHKRMLSLLALENLIVQTFFALHKSRIAKTIFRYGFGTCIFADILLWHTWQLSVGRWRIDQSLPFHICNISILLCGVLLWTKNTYVYEICYFWAAGALQAILTPPLNEYSYPHYFFWRNFFSHNSIIVAVLYMTIVEHYRPTWQSVGRAVLITTAYLVFVAVVNALTGGNYGYIARKPDFASPIDHLGPYPWYIVSMYAIGVGVMVASYLPFALLDRIKKHTCEDSVGKGAEDSTHKC